MALDQKWYPKSAWRHSNFSKNLSFILRGFFFFFWSVAFVFPDILLLQMNNPTPRIRKEPGAQLSSERQVSIYQDLPGKIKETPWGATLPVAKEKLVNFREGKPVRGPALKQGPLASSCRRTGSTKREIPACSASVDLTLTLFQEVGLANVGNWLIFRLCPLDILFPQLLWTYLLSHSVWYKPMMKRKPGRWEDCGARVWAWACPGCQIQGKIFTFSSPDTSSAKWIS